MNKLYLTYYILKKRASQLLKKFFSFLLNIYLNEYINLESYNAKTIIFDNVLDSNIETELHSYEDSPHSLHLDMILGRD